MPSHGGRVLLLRLILLRPQVGKDRMDIGPAVTMVRNGLQLPTSVQPLDVRPVDGQPFHCRLSNQRRLLGRNTRAQWCSRISRWC